MLTNKTVFGIFWSFLEQASRRSISILVTLLLAYFLTPEDYGVVAVMSLFLALGNTLMESGFKQALIRKSKVTQLDINTVFFSNLILAIIAYVSLFFTAPLISEYYDNPQLIILVRVAGLILLSNAFQIVQTALLSKQMQFQALLKANFPAAILSGGAAVFFGYLGFGVWALIGQMIISSVLISIFLWMNSSWRPQCLFSFSSLNEIYNYSYKLFLSSLLDTIYKNIFVVIIAKSFSVAVAGLYFFADRVKELFITQLITSIQSVTFPALSAIQDDTERLQQAYRKIMKVMTFLVFPVLFLFAALADTLFQIFLPDKWLQAVPYLQLMILSCLFTPIISINLNIIKIKGCSGWYLLLEVIKKLTGGIILFFTFKYGVEAMLIGQIISLALNYYPSVYLSNKLVRYNFIHQLSDFMPNLLLSAFVALSTWWLQFYLHYPPLVEFVLFGSFSIIFFIAGAYILKLESLRLTWEMLRNIKNNKRKY